MVARLATCRSCCRFPKQKTGRGSERIRQRCSGKSVGLAPRNPCCRWRSSWEAPQTQQLACRWRRSRSRSGGCSPGRSSGLPRRVSFCRGHRPRGGSPLASARVSGPTPIVPHAAARRKPVPWRPWARAVVPRRWRRRSSPDRRFARRSSLALASRARSVGRFPRLNRPFTCWVVAS